MDSVGGASEAIEKAASLAGVSSYDLVDVNTEVARIFSKKLRRIVEPLEGLDGVTINLTALSSGTGDSSSLRVSRRSRRPRHPVSPRT